MKHFSLSLTEGPIGKQLLSFTIPLILGNLFQQLYNAADTVIVGQFVGDTALAAVGSSSSLIELLISLFMGIGIGAGVIISRYYGAGDMDAMSCTIHTTVAADASLSSGLNSRDRAVTAARLTRTPWAQASTCPASSKDRDCPEGISPSS